MNLLTVLSIIVITSLSTIALMLMWAECHTPRKKGNYKSFINQKSKL